MRAGARPFRPVWLGRQSYNAVHELQHQTRDAVAAGAAPTTLLLLEHDPVITVGRRGPGEDLLVSAEELAAAGIAFRQTERGGQATYHGPGQLVGYPIGLVRALAPDLPTYVWRIEETLLRVARDLGIDAHRHPTHRGVWLRDAKLASIGIAVSRGVSWHGFALNADPDLDAFHLIRACGLDLPATSIQACLGSAPTVDALARQVAREFANVFGLIPSPLGPFTPPGPPLAPERVSPE